MRNLLALWMIIGWISVPLVGGRFIQAASPPISENEWGNLKGQIIVQGSLPFIDNESIPAELAICINGGLGIKDDNLLVGPSGGLADVFIMLVPDDEQAIPRVHPDYETAAEPSVTLEFDNCRLHPHALILRSNQKLILKNNDPVGHHCQIETYQNAANLLVARQSEYSFRFDKSDRTPGKVTCGIHKWIDALILVKDHPYNVISGSDGKFEILNIPAGKWKFMFWHSKTGYMNEMKVSGFTVDRRGEITTQILPNHTLDLGEIMVPSTAFQSAYTAEDGPPNRD